MKEIQFTLSIEETNLILEALGNMPYVKVHQLIHNLQDQARPQLNGAQTVTANDKTISQ